MPDATTPAAKWQVFISYVREDYEHAKRLYDRLQQEPFVPWLDRRDLPLGEIWRDDLTKAIQNSHFFIACVSASYLQKVSENGSVVQQELKAALTMHSDVKLQKNSFTLIPARLETCDLSPALAAFQWVDLFAPDGQDKLLERLTTKRSQWEQLAIRETASIQLAPEPIAEKAAPYPCYVRIHYVSLPEELPRSEMPTYVQAIRNWTMQQSALVRWSFATADNLLRTRLEQSDLLVFPWSVLNHDVARKFYWQVRATREKLPLLLIVADKGDYGARQELLVADPLVQVLSEYAQEGVELPGDEPLAAVFQRLGVHLPKPVARPTKLNDLFLREIWEWLGDETYLNLTVQKFFPAANDFQLEMLSGFGANTKLCRLTVDWSEKTYLLKFFAQWADYDDELKQHRQAERWLDAGVVGLHQVPELVEQREAFPITKPFRYALCYDSHAPSPHRRETLTACYRQREDEFLRKVVRRLLTLLALQPCTELAREAPWHEGDRREPCRQEFCWTSELSRNLLVTLNELALYGTALYGSAELFSPVAGRLTWKNCRDHLKQLIHELPAWLTDHHPVRRGHVHGDPAPQNLLINPQAAEDLRLISCGAYRPTGRLVTDLAVLERDIKLRLLGTEVAVGGFFDLEVVHLKGWCAAETEALAHRLEFQPEHLPEANASVVRAYQLISLVRARAREISAPEDSEGRHYFAALLYKTLELCASPALHPVKKLLALHSAVELLCAA